MGSRDAGYAEPAPNMEPHWGTDPTSELRHGLIWQKVLEGKLLPVKTSGGLN